jgi:hypothetical protein
MSWPGANIANVFIGNANANISDARSEIDSMVGAVNLIIEGRGTASGVAALDGTGKIQSNNLPTTYQTTSVGITLAPGNDRVSVEDIINLNPLNTAAVEAIATPVEGDVVYCTNGDAGSKCIAVYDGTDWLVVSLGSAIATS